MKALLILMAANATAADFARDVAPVLEKRCLMCHGAAAQMAGLRLDSREAAFRVIKPGASAQSKLIEMVEGRGKTPMPPSGPRLTAVDISAMREWIDAGAPWPESAPKSTRPGHWSFQTIARPEPPQVRAESWARNAIDRFVLARLERESVEPSAEASKRTLVRRLYLDITGLPPTPGQVAAWLADNRADAYERLVDSLLESPHYGEKWARHWLDLARYADSDGYEKDNVRPHAWRYRQWVIDALNADMRFDRFTIEQIAGDLLPGATVDQRAATGFHRNTLTNREGGVNLEQFRTEAVKDRAATVGTVWLGLTVGCAQCHDHKYDPITQREFYSLYGFFNNADEVNIDAPMAGEMGPYLTALPEYRRKRRELLGKYGVFEHMPAWEARMREARANPGKWTDWDHAYDALQKYLDNGDGLLDTPAAKRTEKQAATFEDHFVINYHRVISKELWKDLKFPELRKQLDALRAEFPALSEAQAIEERAAATRRKNFVHVRGDYRKHGAEVGETTPGFLPPLPAGPANRLALARWLVSIENPLTARVTVNRIWQEYFGRGLVRTADDFGMQGERPSHPELLDWLAARFVDSGWRVKDLHKLIVTSAAYRQASQARPDIEQRDPDNRLLSRQSRLRLPAELVRDSALQVSGLLYPAIGGRSVRPPQPKGVAELTYGNGVKWNESTGRDRYRRGLYIHFQRTAPYPQLMNFDAPDANVAACKRDRSNSPLQALNLLNDPVFTEAARSLAVRVLEDRSAAGFDARVRYAFELCFARQPSLSERETIAQYYRAQTAIYEMDRASAEAWFPLELPGASRVEAAAWAGTASVLMNSDEFITRE
jgi:cytochrome c5